MADSENKQSNNCTIDKLQDEFNDFVKKQQKDTYIKTPKNKNLALVYTFFCDILGGVLTAFILNNIYKYFFGQNRLVFVVLIIFCIIGSFYGYFKTLMRKDNKDN